MEELPERSEFHRTQRERERERRRVRDRERRLSMTLEQKEKHLERRRRNYQLRRLKAGNLTTNPSFEHSSDSHQAEISIAELDRQQNGFTIIGFNDEQEARNPECIGSLGLENLDQKDASLMGRERVRLNHIRRVARSMSHGNSESTMEESTSNDMQIGESDPSRSPKALRLNHVKCIARMMKSAVKASDDTENQISISEEEIFNDIK